VRTLYLRIWLTVVAALALFAAVSGWLVQRHVEQERARVEERLGQRAAAWAELLQRSLPGADAPVQEQAAALAEWSSRLRLPLALDDAQGRLIAASPRFAALLSRQGDGPPAGAPLRELAFALDDGRTLRVLRMAPPPRVGPSGAHGPAALHGPAAPGGGPWMPRGVPGGLGLAALLLLLLAAVAAGAWPVVRHLTRRLEALKQGVEAFGAGALHQRVAEEGRDEVAALAASFNRAAARIETLLRSHKSLLANASHELRSPLARLKMALAMLDDATPDQRVALRAELDSNIAELDVLVEEVLLASRLDAAQTLERREPVDLLALVAEEASRGGAVLDGAPQVVDGDERLLRRAVRNLLENAQRYGGGGDIDVTLRARHDAVELSVCDRGPGVPAEHRERIFEPFFRLPGHAERAGGVGLGLALVRQIAAHHGGSVRCEERPGGGSCFVVRLPLAAEDSGSPGHGS
jgi:signal transduction histidine kinase